MNVLRPARLTAQPAVDVREGQCRAEMRDQDSDRQYGMVAAPMAPAEHSVDVLLHLSERGWCRGVVAHLATVVVIRAGRE